MTRHVMSGFGTAGLWPARFECGRDARGPFNSDPEGGFLQPSGPRNIRLQYVPFTANVHDVPTISWRVMAVGPLANFCMLM